jgi:hypothetical protein
MRSAVVALAVGALIAAGCAGADQRTGGLSTQGDGHQHPAPAELGESFTVPASCAQALPPLGAIPPGPPVWCLPLAPGRSTARSGANSWTDLFDSGLDHAALPPVYRVFEAARRSQIRVTKHFAHNGHWMVDVSGTGFPPGEYAEDLRDLEAALNWGGGLMRPDRTFRFVRDRLVVEFDVAAGMQAYNEGWPEIVVTTAAAPTGIEVDQLHAIGLFGGAASVGCRLYTDRTSKCSAYDATGRHFRDGGRIFELSADRDEGARVAFGGAPTTASLSSAWHECAPTDPDTKCRDRFRLEIERDAIRLSVNGTVYMEHAGLPAGKVLPRALLDGDVYVYFASWAYLAQPAVERFHWGRIAVNP